jgi:competence protein ComGC
MAPLVWGLYLFPLASGAVSLLLVPAIRRGAAYAEGNGTPWGWPWFPWILFGVLAACAGVRSYWLTLSFYPAEGMLSPFGAYFLVPMVLALAVLLLEAGLVTKRGWLRVAGVALPAPALAMIFPGGGGGEVREQFVRLIAWTATSPALLGATLVLVFYVYAWLRRQRLAEAGVVIALAVVSVVGDETTGLHSLVSPRLLPLAALAVIEAKQFLRRRTSWRAAVLVAGLVAALAAAVRGTWFNSAGGIVPLHLAYAGALVVGACFRDRFAGFLQSAGALVLAVVFLVALFFGDRLLPGSAGWSRTTYVVAAFALAPLYWLIVRNVQYMRVLLLNVAATALWALGGAYVLASRLWRKRGAALIFWGGASFVLAALISILKTGALRKLTGPVRELAGLDALGVWLKRNSVRIVVLVLIVGLSSLLLLPCLCAARERARRTGCASNLKQIGYGVHLYSSDNDERFPENLPVLNREDYLKDHKVYICVSARRKPVRYSRRRGDPLTEDHMSYCYVSGVQPTDPPEYVVAFDEEWNHEGDGLNVLFTGGNVQWQRDIGEFHEKLRMQLAELKAAGRRVQVLRPSWSRYPELPEHGLWGTSRRGALTRTVAAAAAVMLVLDVGLLAAYLTRRRRPAEAVAKADG